MLLKSKHRCKSLSTILDLYFVFIILKMQFHTNMLCKGNKMLAVMEDSNKYSVATHNKRWK